MFGGGAKGPGNNALWQFRSQSLPRLESEFFFCAVGVAFVVCVQSALVARQAVAERCVRMCVIREHLLSYSSSTSIVQLPTCPATLPPALSPTGHLTTLSPHSCSSLSQARLLQKTLAHRLQAPTIQLEQPSAPSNSSSCSSKPAAAYTAPAAAMAPPPQQQQLGSNRRCCCPIRQRTAAGASHEQPRRLVIA